MKIDLSKLKSPYRIAQAKAKAADKRFFKGIVCSHHPELEGERRAINGACPQCVRDRMKRLRLSDPEAYNRKKNEERRNRKFMKEAGVWVDLRKQRKAPGVVSARGKVAEGARRTRGGVNANVA